MKDEKDKVDKSLPPIRRTVCKKEESVPKGKASSKEPLAYAVPLPSQIREERPPPPVAIRARESTEDAYSLVLPPPITLSQCESELEHPVVETYDGHSLVLPPPLDPYHLEAGGSPEESNPTLPLASSGNKKRLWISGISILLLVIIAVVVVAVSVNPSNGIDSDANGVGLSTPSPTEWHDQEKPPSPPTSFVTLRPTTTFSPSPTSSPPTSALPTTSSTTTGAPTTKMPTYATATIIPSSSFTSIRPSPTVSPSPV